MPSYSRLLTVSLVSASGALWASCLPLEPGHSLKGFVSRNSPACFFVTVKPGEAAQVAVGQPEDLEIRIEGGSAPLVVDSFEFGWETATIDVPGQYRLEVRRALNAMGSPLSFLMSRKEVSLQQASLWRKAEVQSAACKRSGRLEYFAEARRLWEAAGDKSCIARITLEKGDALLNAGDLVAAYGAYEEALQTCRSIADVRCSAEAANNSGFVAQQLGFFGQSLKRLQAAVDDWGRVPNRLLEGRTLSNIGLLYWQTGDFERAISFYDRAGNILRRRDSLAYARVLNNLGLCYLSLAEYDKARGDFEPALAEFAKRRNWRDRVIARMNIGRSYMLEHRIGLARRILERALREAAAHELRAARALILTNLGQTLLQGHLYAEAESTFNAALDLNRSLGDKAGESAGLHYMGIVALERGQVDVARPLLVQALEIRRERGLRNDAPDSLFSLALLELTAGNLQQARDYGEQALKMMESVRSQVPGPSLRASYYAQKRKFFDLFVDIAMRANSVHAAEDGLLAAERGRGRALLDLLAEGSIVHRIPRDLLSRRTAIQQSIDLLIQAIPAAGPKRQLTIRRQVESLVADDEEVEARVRELLTGEKLGRPLHSITEIQSNAIPADSVLLEYHLSEPHSYLWLVSRDNVKVFSLPPRAAIESQSSRAIELFGRYLDRRRSPELQIAFTGAIRRLSKTLLGPLNGASLPDRLILVPDGVLERVPFAALLLPLSNERLGLTHDLVQVPSAAYLMTGRQPRPLSEFPQAFLAVADPVFSVDDPRIPASARLGHPVIGTAQTLARLPFSAELDAISHLAPPSDIRILRGFSATAQTLRTLRLEDYALLHFSTHALIDDRIPDLSYIALSMVDRTGRPVDGFLRPYHLAEFHLNGCVVILSACNTALGKQVVGEGLAGFSASLFHAGAAQLVLALSEVDAESSSAFFSETYRQLLTKRLTGIEHAMTLARRAISRSARWADPYCWASFIVVGRPGEAVLSSPDQSQL